MSLSFSDIGSNTLLIPRAVHEGYAFPNRLELLRKWVEKGGAFLMCGGWASFSGMNGTAHYHRTPIEELLPVDIHPFDDRMESPQGVTACIRLPNHPILKEVPDAWPPLRDTTGWRQTVAAMSSSKPGMAIRCWWLGPTGQVDPQPGHQISPLIGSAISSPPGKDTTNSSPTSSRGCHPLIENRCTYRWGRLPNSPSR